MGEVKPKKEATEEGEANEVSYEDKLKNCNPIADPMAPKKLTKKIFKLIKKGIIKFSIPILNFFIKILL